MASVRIAITIKDNEIDITIEADEDALPKDEKISLPILENAKGFSGI